MQQINDEMLTKIKHIEFEMLKALLKCCDELNIKVFLVGGTALGAVRHQGFILWDDDIDVAMRRTDFELFITKGQEFLPRYLFLQSRLSEQNLLCNFAKIRDSRTTFIESSQRDRKINHGIFIDVFPLDFFPEDESEIENLQKKLRMLNLRIRQEYTLPEENRGSKIVEMKRRIAGRLLQWKYPSVMTALDLKDEIVKSVKPSTYLVNYCGAWGNKEVFPAEWLGEGTNAFFEGLTVSIPQEYDKYLTHIYGDYMQLPPVEKRITHHYTEVIDTERPYTEYM